LNTQNKIENVNLFKKKIQKSLGRCLEMACSLRHFVHGEMSVLTCVWTNCDLNTFN